MKKILALVLALVMTLALAACGNTDAKPNDTGADGEAAGWTPSANITVIVPYSAGGTTDLSVRGVTGAIDTSVLPSGVNVVVDNVAGGSGLVGIPSSPTLPTTATPSASSTATLL